MNDVFSILLCNSFVEQTNPEGSTMPPCNAMIQKEFITSAFFNYGYLNEQNKAPLLLGVQAVCTCGNVL